jgi:hypothetical protein
MALDVEGTVDCCMKREILRLLRASGRDTLSVATSCRGLPGAFLGAPFQRVTMSFFIGARIATNSSGGVTFVGFTCQ